jgi:hypothetical protein
MTLAGVLTIAGAADALHFNTTTTGANYLSFVNTGGNIWLGLDASTAASFSTGNYAGVLQSSSSGGLSIAATHASGAIRYYSGGTTERMSLSSAGLLTVSGAGAHTFGGGGASTTSNININGATGANLGSYIAFQRGGASKGFLGTDSTVVGGGSNSDQLDLYAVTSLAFFTNNTTTPRWGINAAGDWTYGASSHIADSVGTPTIASAVPALFKSGTIAGTDYAFVITNGSGTPPDGSVNFGHTWSTAPVCTVTMSDSSAVYISAITTTQLTLVNNTAGVGSKYFVLCRSY